MPYFPPAASATTTSPSFTQVPKTSSGTTPTSECESASLPPETSSNLPSQEDLPTPRPRDTSEPSGSQDRMTSSSLSSDPSREETLRNLSESMARTSLSPDPNNATSEDENLPGLSNTPSASTVSMSSLMSSSSENGMDSREVSPPTSLGTPTENEEDVKNAVTRYRENLYAYTRGLYLEAKLNNSRAESRRNMGITSGGFDQFGVKPSGMEKMRAKKALAQRLRD